MCSAIIAVVDLLWLLHNIGFGQIVNHKQVLSAVWVLLLLNVYCNDAEEDDSERVQLSSCHPAETAASGEPRAASLPQLFILR